MQHKAAMLRYLDAFTRGDVAGILELFAKDSLVHSPTQEKPKFPQEFYPALLEKAKGTIFTVKAVYSSETPNRAAVQFDYKKPLSGGGMHVFDCVDIFDFDADGKIKELWIIFDTKNLAKT